MSVINSTDKDISEVGICGNDGEDNIQTYDPTDHQSMFNAMEYLKHFYISPDEDVAMKIVLFFLPGLALKIPESQTLLDIGSGPTVHVALAFRNRVQKIFLSDFAEKSREELQKWWENRENCFDWTPIINWISLLEGHNESSLSIAKITRDKLHGILYCDVLAQNVIDDRETENCRDLPSQFDVVTTIFCLEYATKTREQYRSAVENVVRLLKPGGYILMGGVLEETSYYFGSTKFRCFTLKKSELISALKDAGIDISSDRFKMIVHNDVFLVLAPKLRS